MSWCVYAIVDPRVDAIFYIGQTRSFPHRRAQHLAGTDQMSGVIIGQILEAGFLPHFCVLERHVSEDAALRAEIFWIELLMARGFALANCQAFAKPGDRKAKRKAETSRLADMQRLRAVANGRPTKRKAKPRQRSKGWQKRDLNRLRGMTSSGMDVPSMAKILGRSQDDVRKALAASKTD